MPTAPSPARPRRRLAALPDLPGTRAAEPDDGGAHLTVPVPRSSPAAAAAPWRSDDEVAWVPAVLLLATAGRCSCDDCCADLARRQARRRLALA